MKDARRTPRSITEIVYTYRSQHSNAAWDQLVDVGVSSGIATSLFTPDFKTIHVSKPIATKLSQARSSLLECAQRQNVDVTLEYHEATASHTAPRNCTAKPT